MLQVQTSCKQLIGQKQQIFCVVVFPLSLFADTKYISCVEHRRLIVYPLLEEKHKYMSAKSLPLFCNSFVLSVIHALIQQSAFSLSMAFSADRLGAELQRRTAAHVEVVFSPKTCDCCFVLAPKGFACNYI